MTKRKLLEILSRVGDDDPIEFYSEEARHDDQIMELSVKGFDLVDGGGVRIYLEI